MIIGQENAIKEVSQAIKRSKVGLSPQNKPIASFLCIGKTGVGKTLMAKILAKEIFGDEKYLVRFDMSEYADKTSVNKLIGSSAGYVGYQEGGLLTDAIRKTPYCVLLLDYLHDYYRIINYIYIHHGSLHIQMFMKEQEICVEMDLIHIEDIDETK